MTETARPTHADLVLAGIALPLLVAGGATVLSSVSAVVALAAGALPSTATLGYALFFAPPEPDQQDR